MLARRKQTGVVAIWKTRLWKNLVGEKTGADVVTTAVRTKLETE